MIPELTTKISGRYRITGILGHGGMGGVYAAFDERLGRNVALKMLRPDIASDARSRERFLREAQIAARMRHSNVVRTFDVGDAPEGPYLIQELLEGRTLAVEQLPPRRALAVMRDIASALHYIHEQGFLHCDLKPANIMLVDGETRAVLLDFGIARDAGADSSSLIATPLYLAPERIYGMAPSAASDLYSLGIVLYVMLSGQLPFNGPDINGILIQHQNEPLPPLALSDPTAQALEALAIRLAAKQPAERYPSAAALLDDLQRVEDGAVDAIATLAPSPPAPGAAQAPAAAGLAAAASPPVVASSSVAASPPIAAPKRRARTWLLPLLLLLLIGSTALIWPDAGKNALNAAPMRFAPAQAPIVTSSPPAAPPSRPEPTLVPTAVEPTPPPATAVPEPDIVAPPSDDGESDRGRGNNRGDDDGEEDEDEDD